MNIPKHSTLSLLPLLLLGCQKAGPGHPFFDFAANFEAADVRREVDEIKFGTPEADPHLREGWSVNERTPQGHTFVWSDGEESTLDFFLSSPRPLELAVRCAPLGLPGSPPQTVSVVLNGAPVEDFVLAPGRHDYRTTLPAERLWAGENRLRFRYAYTRLPAASPGGADDRRRLAVAWFRLRLGAAESEGGREPSVDVATGTLRVPWAIQLDYHLRLPPGAQLGLDGVALGGNGRLALLLQPDGESERVLATFEASSGRQTIPLDGDGGKVARLSFRALAPAGGRGAAGAARIERPLLRTTAAPATPGPEATPARVPTPPSRPPVFIYLVDALRADHLGCYGYPKPVSPHIDAFAAEAHRFRAVAQSSWTKAAVVSIFTGLSPIAHGVQDRRDTLAPDAATLSKLLGAAGYRTLALYANVWLSETFGLDQGFEDRRLLPQQPSDELHREFVSWLDRNAGRRQPLFAYVHTIDPHAPYSPPAELRARFAGAGSRLRSASTAWLRQLGARKRRGEPIPSSLIEDVVALYDAEIAFNDAQFGHFLRELKDRGLYDDALIVFTADHGEEFFEKDSLGHGFNLSAPVLDIPFIVKAPRGAGPRRPAVALAQQVDILPTILDLLDLPLPPGTEGRSVLAPAADGEPAPAERAVFSYLDLDGNTAQSVIEGPWKLVRVGRIEELRPRLELHDRRRGDDRHDLRDEHPVMTRYLLGKLRRHAADSVGPPASTHAVISPEVEEKLRALGYLW